MSIPRDISAAIDQLDQLASGKEKSPAEIEERTEKVCRQALQILASPSDLTTQGAVFAALKHSLKRFELTLDQRKRLYSALAKSPLGDAQTHKLDKRDINYEEFSDIYTLEFQDGTMKISKAELSTLGDYFTALFASGMLEAASKTIALKDLETEQFDYLRKYMNDTCQYDLDDPDTWRTLKTLVGRFNQLPVYPNSITSEQWANPAAFLEILPSMPRELVDFLDGPCPIYEGQTARKTHIVVPLIKNFTSIVDSKPLILPRTLQTLDELDKASGGVGCRPICDRILKPDVDKPSEVEFEWAVMTKDILPGSRNQTYDVQKQLAEDKGYQVPSFLDAATCILWAQRHSGTHHCSGPWTYTCCREMLGGWRLNVGGFDPRGLLVDHRIAHEYIGIAGLRKFPVR